MNIEVSRMYEYEIPAQQGWVCPKCGRVYSPTTIMCLVCGGIEVTDYTTMTIGTAKPITLDDFLGKNTTGVGEQDE